MGRPSASRSNSPQRKPIKKEPKASRRDNSSGSENASGRKKQRRVSSSSREGTRNRSQSPDSSSKKHRGSINVKREKSTSRSPIRKDRKLSGKIKREHSSSRSPSRSKSKRGTKGEKSPSASASVSPPPTRRRAKSQSPRRDSLGRDVRAGKRASPTPSPKRPRERKSEQKGDQGPQKGDPRPQKGDQRPQKGDQRPQKSDQRPQKGDQRPQKGDQKPQHKADDMDAPLSWAKPSDKEKPKEKPNYQASGKLVKDANTVNGTQLKYVEPPDARAPDRRWRLYVFKKGKDLDPLHVHRKSSYLIGRDRQVVALNVDHPSCSKQHAVLQFRQRTTATSAEGAPITQIKPYIIDLNSTNGTFINGKRIDGAKFYELLPQDVLKFGHSTREYVLLHSESAEAGKNGGEDEDEE